MKKKTKIIIAVIILILIVLAIYLTSPTLMTTTKYITDPILGNIKTEVVNNGIMGYIINLFNSQQTYFKTPLSIPLGTSTKACDVVGIYNRCDLYTIKNVNIHIYKDGKEISVQPVTIPCVNSPNAAEFCLTYRPPMIGVYTAELWLDLANKGTTNFAPIKSWQTNSLTVTAVTTPACTKSEYASGNWQTVETIEGGIVEQKVELRLNPNTCSYEQTGGFSSVTRTTCNSDYILSGSVCALKEVPVVVEPVVDTPTDITTDITTDTYSKTADKDNVPNTTEYSTTTQVIFWIIVSMIVILVVFIIYRLSKK